MTFSLLQTLFLNVFLLAFSYTKEAALVITKESLDSILCCCSQTTWRPINSEIQATSIRRVKSRRVVR